MRDGRDFFRSALFGRVTRNFSYTITRCSRAGSWFSAVTVHPNDRSRSGSILMFVSSLNHLFVRGLFLPRAESVKGLLGFRLLAV
jgi:hypothetical protein